MAHREWCLRPGEELKPNEHLRSKNGMFYAVMQEDGNFGIWRGDWWEAPPDTLAQLWDIRRLNDYARALVNNGIISPYLVLRQPGMVKAVMQADGNFVFYAKAIPNQRNETALWATNTSGQPGNWAVLQDDGNFSIRRNGDINESAKWHAGVADSLDEANSHFTEIVYDFKNRIVKPGVPQNSSTSTAINKTEINQSSTLSLVYTESKAWGWKKSSSIKIGTKVGFKVGVPATTGELSMEASFEATRAYEENETKTKTEQKTISLPVVVPPGKGVIGQVTWSDSTITLPFRLKGEGTFRSGYKTPISVNGMYEGIATTDVTTTWIPYKEKEEANARAMLMAVPRTVLP
jgi:hypothetical protein